MADTAALVTRLREIHELSCSQEGYHGNSDTTLLEAADALAPQEALDADVQRGALVEAHEEAPQEAPAHVTLDEIQHLRRYVEECGGQHDDGCPEDDTCDCSWRPTLDAVNALCNRKPEAHVTREQAEARLTDDALDAIKSAAWQGDDEWRAAILGVLFPHDGSRT